MHFRGGVCEEVHKTCYKFPWGKPPQPERVRRGFMSGGPPFKVHVQQSSFALLRVSVPMPPVSKAFSDSRHLKLKSTWKEGLGVLLFPVAQLSEVPNFTAQKYPSGNLFRMQMLGPSTWDAGQGNLTSVMKPAYVPSNSIATLDCYTGQCR